MTPDIEAIKSCYDAATPLDGVSPDASIVWGCIPALIAEVEQLRRDNNALHDIGTQNEATLNIEVERLSGLLDKAIANMDKIPCHCDICKHSEKTDEEDPCDKCFTDNSKFEWKEAR